MVAFTAGAVLTAANLNTAFNALTFRAVTGTSDTFLLADNGGAVSFSNASPITATVPPFSSVAYANGTVIQLLNLGAGVVTVTAGVGVTLNGSSVAIAQNTGGTLIKTATNTWYFLPSASTGSGLVHLNTYDFSAASSFSISNVFSATYTHYRVMLNAVASADVQIRFRLRVGGVDSTAASSDFQLTTGASGTVGTVRSTGQTYNYLVRVPATGSNYAFAQMDISQPFVAVPTLYNNNSMYWTGINQLAVAGIHNVSTSYDSITFLTDTGNITGSVSIFGYARS